LWRIQVKKISILQSYPVSYHSSLFCTSQSNVCFLILCVTGIYHEYVIKILTLGMMYHEGLWLSAETLSQ
jgi:hypothetical protein